MKTEDFIDDEKNFPNKKISKVLNTIKPAFVLGLSAALKCLPKDQIVDSIEKCNSTEMKRQYIAFERAFKKWNGGQELGKESRREKSLWIIKDAYFTALQYEANYLILSAYIFDEYRKIRESGEKIE